MAEEKYLFDKPFGPSEREWNNLRLGVHEATCGLCGTVWPYDENRSLSLSRFLGRTIVEQCCGKVLDMVLKESGGEMVRELFKEFPENPNDPRLMQVAEAFAVYLEEPAKQYVLSDDYDTYMREAGLWPKKE